jgi:segregation and condensation protein B
MRGSWRQWAYESTKAEGRMRSAARACGGGTVTDRREMEGALEAVLFVSSEPVSRDKLVEMFDEDERDAAAEALDAVLERYRPVGGEEGDGGGTGRGVMIEEVAGGIRLVTRPEMNGWLRRFFEVRGGSKLSMAALETLAIIAYRQPVTGPEIQELRSVNPSGVLKTLLEKHLVRIAGRKEVVGKPFLYCTTREFLVHFGLKSLKDLPPLEEFEEAFGGEGEGYAYDDGRGRDPDEEREQRIVRETEALEESEESEKRMDHPAEIDAESGTGTDRAPDVSETRRVAEVEQ